MYLSEYLWTKVFFCKPFLDICLNIEKSGASDNLPNVLYLILSNRLLLSDSPIVCPNFTNSFTTNGFFSSNSSVISFTLASSEDKLSFTFLKIAVCKILCTFEKGLSWILNTIWSINEISNKPDLSLNISSSV